MNKKKKILLITNVIRSFVKEDINLLSRDYNVVIYNFNVVKYNSKFIRLFFLLYHSIAQLFWLLYHLPNSKFIYGWFVDYHLLLPVWLKVIFRKKLIIALGGFECIHIPTLKYGIYESWWRSIIVKHIIPKADMLLPVTDKLISTHPQSAQWPDAHPNGLKHHIKEFNTPYSVLYTAYDDEFWNFTNTERGKVVCTVAIITNEVTFLRKGGDLFIETAKHMPDFTFNLVGLDIKQIEYYKTKYSAPKNVIFLPKQARENLKKVYTEASVYLQLSRAEGLPNVLCEAMLCGCVPVGSAVFGIPETISDTGFVVEKPEITDIVEKIKNAHNSADRLRRKARERIKSDFLLEDRYKALKNISSF